MSEKHQSGALNNLVPREARPVERRSWSWRYLVSATLLGGWYLYQNPGIVTNVFLSSSEGSKGSALPQLYAICSKEGNFIYTSEEGNPQVECVAVLNGTIVGVGARNSVQSAEYASTAAPVYFELPKGSILTPGFVDSHAHTLQYGKAQELPLAGSKSVKDVIKRLEAYVIANKEAIDAGQWVEGQGWDQNLWDVKELPTAADFDSSPLLRNLPISLARIDIHAEWVSNKVLEMLGKLPDTVEGGKIIRDGEGRATGVFVDDAMNLITSIRPPWTDEQTKRYLDTTIRDAVAKGVTGIHDAYGAVEHVKFYEKLAEKGELPIRFYIMRACPNKEKYCGDQHPMIKNPNGMLDVRSVKLFADGALGSWGAALIEPYSDKPNEYGIMRTPEEVWPGLIDEFVKNGWQTNVHCIGDRANHVVLDAMEAAIKKYGPADRRLRIEHSQIMTPADLKRAVGLGVIASYQPTHGTSDMWYAEERLGAERLKGAYAWQSYLRLGGRICLGSDFPVESIDPLKGFFAAIARTDEAGNSPHGRDGWFPEEKLTRQQALRGFTIDAAYASFREADTGSFAIGKRFDAVIWDRDIMQVEPALEVLKAKALATIANGELVHGKLR